jgi:hypothetical protein
MLKNPFRRPAPVSENPLHGVLTETEVQALRERNACRLDALNFILGRDVRLFSGRHGNWEPLTAGLDEDPHRPWWPAEGG